MPTSKDTLIRVQILGMRLHAAIAARRAKQLLPDVLPYYAIPNETINNLCFSVPHPRGDELDRRPS